MHQYGIGTLPDSAIHELMKKGNIVGANPDNVNPASLDLSLSEEIYRTNGVFLPRCGETVRALLPLVGADRHDLGQPLERDVTYVARLNESLALAGLTIAGVCNAKSSTGRNFFLVRGLTDNLPGYDVIRRSATTEIWLVITPKAFPARVAEGTTLNQLRLTTADTRVGAGELQILWRECGFSVNGYEPKINPDGSVALTVDINSHARAYRARKTNKVFGMSRGDERVNKRSDFFDELDCSSGTLFLKKDEFYVLSAKEPTCVPPGFACEMLSTRHKYGEFCPHRAGFIDPGWGYDPNSFRGGRRLTLELCPYEDILIRDGQPVADIFFEKMAKDPDIHYDQRRGSHYKNQETALLSKHVDMRE